MKDDTILQGLRNLKSSVRAEINTLAGKIQHLEGFSEAYQIAIDLIERERSKETKVSP